MFYFIMEGRKRFLTAENPFFLPKTKLLLFLQILLYFFKKNNTPGGWFMVVHWAMCTDI